MTPADMSVFTRRLSAWRSALAAPSGTKSSSRQDRHFRAGAARILDRLLFLRLSEERGLEPEGQLQNLSAGQGHAFARGLGRLFARSAVKYPSLLFGSDAPGAGKKHTSGMAAVIHGRAGELRAVIRDLYDPPIAHFFKTAPDDLMGRIHEHRPQEAAGGRSGPDGRDAGRSGNSRKTTGRYYTPDPIVEYLVDRVFQTLALSNPVPTDTVRNGPNSCPAPLRFLDPACGSGRFLLAVCQRLFDQTDSRPTIANRFQIVRDCIFGVDLDPMAVEAARLALLLKAYQGLPRELVQRHLVECQGPVGPDLRHNITCGNSLIPFDGEHRYDVVIGNPPYLSFSGRQAVAFPAGIKAAVSQHDQTRGWPSAHGLFIERSVKTLAKRVTALVLPDQVGHLPGYGGLRRLVSQHTTPVEVRYWGERVFPEAVTPILTLIADRNYRGRTRVRTTDGRVWRGVLTDADRWGAPARANRLLNRVQGAAAASLGALVADPGVHTGNCAARLVLPLAAATADAVPVLEGRQISRYRCSFPAKALRLTYEPQEGEYFTIRPADRYRAAPFLIRQTAACPIVGPRRHTDYFRNSLLALYAPDAAKGPLAGHDVRYLAAVLNSKLMAAVYRAMIWESRQKSFPQVKVGSLRMLPIRELDLGRPDERLRHDQIVAAVDVLLDGRQTERMRQADSLIDRLVNELYELSDREVETLTSLGSS